MGKWIAAFVLLGAVTWAPTAQAQPSDITPESSRAIGRALAYLARNQEANGSWKGDVGYKLNYDYKYTEKNVGHVGVTALACMSFLAAGNLPGRGKYGANVRRGLDYILKCSKRDGFVTANGSRMYSHAFATLFLAEVFGATNSRRVRDALKRAVFYIIVQQNGQGGWRYAPGAQDSDMSIVVCQVQALRAARNVGVSVPIQTIKRAQRYVRRSANPNGSFNYQIAMTSRQSFALCAAGVTALQGTAIYTDVMVKSGLEFLRHIRNSERYGTYFYYYGHYYAVQAMYIGGLKWPRFWREWYPHIRDELVFRQDKTYGYWHNLKGPGQNLATAMGALILQIPYRYLPIFQR